MKRTALLFSLLLCLAWQGAIAQGPLPVRVSHDNAARFVKENPQFAQHFAFEKDGTVYCGEQAALTAYLKFERDNGLPSTLAATSLTTKATFVAEPAMPVAAPATKETPRAEISPERELTPLPLGQDARIGGPVKGNPQPEIVKVDETLKIELAPAPTAYPDQR